MLRLKPPVAVRPGALVRARHRTALGPRAEDALFSGAEVLSEGRRDGAAFFGSTLVTIDLARLATSFADDAAELDRDRLFRAMEGSVRVRLHAMRLATSDVARRFPDVELGTARVETRFRREGARVHIDVDVEVPLSQPSSLNLGGVRS